MVGESRPSAACVCAGRFVFHVMLALDDVTATTRASEIARVSSGGVGASAEERPVCWTTSRAGAFAGFTFGSGFAEAARIWTSGVCFVGTRVNGLTRGETFAAGVAAAG